MADGINNSLKTYKFQNTQLQKYDTDGDGTLSIFEIENISDEEGTNLLCEELPQFTYAEDNEAQLKSLNAQLQSVKDEQGAISSLWNGIKCLTNIGSSTEKCEKAIEQFKNGEISYEEASATIAEFQTKQASSVNIAANVATGITAVAAVGTAIVTGGLSPVAGAAIGAGVGAATKAGLKFIDRATNKVEGDALDGKQITKDALSGAVDGAVSVATMGIGSTAVTGKTVAEQTLKQTVIQGAKKGALDGAISGAVTGAADYTIEAAIEEDVEFDIGDMAKTAAVNAAGGALAGGIAGGVSSGMQYKSIDKLLNKRQTKYPELSKEQIAELTDQAKNLHSKYSNSVDKASASTEKAFGEIDGIIVTSRPKSENSIFEKLAKKLQDGELSVIDEASCLDAIGDGVGIRVQIKSLTQDEAQGLIEGKLKNTGISYDDFIKYLKGDTADFDTEMLTSLDAIKPSVINTLKEAQTQDTFEALLNAIKNGDITITELNNYGDELSSYFTNRQLQELADVYPSDSRLNIVSKMDKDFEFNHQNIELDGDKTIVKTETLSLTEKGATKKSGYTSTQMNTKYDFDDSINGELQIRGTSVNEFADVEHIPYDIRQGKITELDTEYAPIYDTIKKMSDDSYKQYNKYLTKVYNQLRLKELGIETAEPILSRTFVTKSGEVISDETLQMLTRSGLTDFVKSLH